MRECMYCEATFSNNKLRRRHVHRVHNQAKAFCPTCNEPFLAEEHCLQHCQDKMHEPLSLTTTRSPRSPINTMRMSASSSSELYRQDGDDLDTFISRKIQPTAQFNASCSEAIDKLVTSLQHNMPDSLRPRRVIKGGSLCKGTAVLNKSDIDIVVMLSNYNDVRSLKRDLPDLKEKFRRHLPTNVTYQGTTPFAIQLGIRCSQDHIHSADVLPAVDVTDLKTLSGVYQDMSEESDETRRYYYACLAPLQNKLFATLPTKLKSLIRLVKYWKKEEYKSLSFPSYVLELVVLNAWCQAGQPGNFEMKRAVHAVLTSLTNHRTFRVVFPANVAMYNTGSFRPVGVPYIMDPCNPYNNVYGSRSWDALALEANTWLSQSTFRGVSNTSRMW